MPKTVTPKKTRDMNKFSQAVAKIADAATAYRDYRIKHIEYTSQCDSAIQASGWSPEDFQKEIEIRRRNLNV